MFGGATQQALTPARFIIYVILQLFDLESLGFLRWNLLVTLQHLRCSKHYNTKLGRTFSEEKFH